MAVHSCDASGDDTAKFSKMMGPGQIDVSIRQALQLLWMIMPEDRKTVDEVEKEFRRLAERALKDLREDATAFRRDKNA